MSIFSAIGDALKGGLGVVGDIAKTAAPVLGFIPGVGTIAGGAIGGLGSLASDIGHGRSLNLGGALGSGLKGALGGLAGGALRGAGGLGSLFGGGGGGALGSLFGGGGGQGGQQQGQGGGPNWAQLAQLGLAGANTVQGAQQQAKAQALRDQLLNLTNSQQGDRDIARKQLMGRLGQVNKRPDLGSLFAGAPTASNPFSQPYQRPM